MRSATTAHSTRSPRNFGKITPRDTAPTWCPARPTRCRPAATEGGDSTCTTRSTAPMSMPSSSEDVATTAGRRPAFSSSSTSCAARATPIRGGRGRRPPHRRVGGPGLRHHLGRGAPLGQDPAPARSEASSLSRAVRRSARRREFANTIVDRWDSNEVEHAFLDVRPDRGSALRPGGGAGEVVGRFTEVGHVLDRNDDLQLERLLIRRLHHRDRPAAGQEGRDLVHRADRRRQPDALCRMFEQRVEPFERQRECAPALRRQTACTSSTITVSTRAGTRARRR